VIPEVSPEELKRELDSTGPPIIIDVREAEELEISRFANFIHIPMMEIPSRMGELDRNADLVIVCRIGERSAHVAHYLAQAGFSKVRNLAGGINRWAALIDPSVAQY